MQLSDSFKASKEWQYEMRPALVADLADYLKDLASVNCDPTKTMMLRGQIDYIRSVLEQDSSLPIQIPF